MKRRSKGRATAVKVRRPKSARLKRQGMAKDLSGHPAADEKSEISRLARELKEARAKQRATSATLPLGRKFGPQPFKRRRRSVSTANWPHRRGPASRVF